MTITASDIKILASERMRDTADGGGYATAIALQSGAENNMFPDVSDADRVWGYLRLRKVFCAIVNAGTDALLGAYAILEDMPDDPDTTAWLRKATSQFPTSEERSTATQYLDEVFWHRRYSNDPPWQVDGSDRRLLTGATAPQVGQVIHAWTPNGDDVGFAVITNVIDTGGGHYRCHFDGWPNGEWEVGVPGTATKAEAVSGERGVQSTLAIAGGLSAGATAATCATPLFVHVIPKQLGVYLSLGGGTSGSTPVAGVAPCIIAGDTLVVHHSEDTAPTTVIAGSVIACGRSDLASARVWGANGAEITSGFSVDLAAGTVTVNNPSGWSQPVVVRHRIEDVIGCARVDWDIPGRLEFNRPLARAFPSSGTLLSSAVLLGDMQALVAGVFSQSLWTSVWSYARIGAPIVGQYDDVGHPISVTNRDAITERWAIEFLTTTSFRLFGEMLGELHTGTVNVDLAPLNPATGQPYFTLHATGWGDGWAAGNVLRFDTQGASMPLWVARVVMPSPPGGGGDSLTLAIKGNIDA